MRREKGGPLSTPSCFQGIHDSFGFRDSLLGHFHRTLGLLVDAVDDGLCMALCADLAHVCLGVQIIWPLLRNGIREVVRQTLGGPQVRGSRATATASQFSEK